MSKHFLDSHVMARIFQSLLVLIVLSSFLSIFCFGAKTETNNNGPYKVLRTYADNKEQLGFLHDLWLNASFHKLDFWRNPTKLKIPVDVMVGRSELDELTDSLKERKIQHDVIIEDVQKLIKQQSEKSDELRKFFQRDDSSSSVFRIDQYNSYDQIKEYLRKLQRSYPDIVSVFSIGETFEQRPLYVVKIGKPSGFAKKAIWIDAGIHAREWIAPTTAIYIIQQLVTRYSFDFQIRNYVDQLDWHIMPLVNPDGYEFSRTSSEPKIRLWRKNKSSNQFCRGTECCDGVDLNRNFDFNWGQAGASNYPCDEMYAGSFAFSERETSAIRDYFESRASNFIAFITLHSYSQIWIYPWGHAVRSYPLDVLDLHKVAVKAKDAILSASRNKTLYIVGTGADTLYPATGGSDDWAKQTLGIKYSYLVELRPADRGLNGFLLEESEIIPTGYETFEAVKVVADAVIKHTPSSQATTPNGEIITEYPDENCKNEDSSCAWWASIGWCHSVADMRERCTLACRFCVQTKK